MIASALRPLMTALLRRSNPRRFKRQRLIKLLVDADRRLPALRRRPALPR
jgi:hypothetical protein